MKKSLPIIIVVIILLAGGYYFFTNKPGKKINSTSGNNTSTESGKKESFVGSLKKAVELNVPMECTYEMNGTKVKSYIRGKKFSGEMETPQGLTYVIIKDNCMWTWQKDTKQGVKTCFKNEDENETSIWDDFDKKTPDAKYNCHPAVISENAFDIPTGVNFMDFDNFGK